MYCESFCRLPFITKFTSAVVLDEEDIGGGPILPELSEIKLLAACLAADPSLIQQHINFHAWICHLSAKMIRDKNATDNGWKMNASHERFLAGEVLVLPQLWACWCPSGCPILLSLSFSLARAAYCHGMKFSTLSREQEVSRGEGTLLVMTMQRASKHFSPGRSVITRCFLVILQCCLHPVFPVSWNILTTLFALFVGMGSLNKGNIMWPFMLK